MVGKFRRAALAVVLLAVAGGTLSACAVYADRPYGHHGWNDRDHRDRDHDGRRW